MASSYMEWSIFDPILAHISFETMFPKGRSPLLFNNALDLFNMFKAIIDQPLARSLKLSNVAPGS